MVVKTIKRHVEINLDFLKLKLKNLRGGLYCPMCNKNMSKVKTFALCSKCDSMFSKVSDIKKKQVTKKIKHALNPSQCSFCDQKDLELDNKLYYCNNCGITFHQ
jgi:Zn finger protein HypA/HybF involved in hydrogenase expression